jgi:hypothetical protein
VPADAAAFAGSGRPAMATHADDDAKRSTASVATSTITVARAIEEKYGRGGEARGAVLKAGATLTWRGRSASRTAWQALTTSVN